MFEQAQIPYFFSTEDERRRIRLKSLLLLYVDRADSAGLGELEAILKADRRPKGEPIPVSAIAINAMPGLGAEMLQHQFPLRDIALAMVDVAIGRFDLLRSSEVLVDAHILCGVGWLLQNKKTAAEITDYIVDIVDEIRVVLAGRGSPLSESELVALGFIGAKASKRGDILALAASVRKALDELSPANEIPLTIPKVISRVRGRSALTEQDFATSLQISVDQLSLRIEKGGSRIANALPSKEPHRE